MFSRLNSSRSTSAMYRVAPEASVLSIRGGFDSGSPRLRNSSVMVIGFALGLWT